VTTSSQCKLDPPPLAPLHGVLLVVVSYADVFEQINSIERIVLLDFIHRLVSQKIEE
jgi:hypothetical protein